MTIKEFCDKYNAGSNCREWALKNCSSMSDVYDKCENSDWLLWMLGRSYPDRKSDFVKLAVIFAEKVLPIFEAKYPNDYRPRKAIEAAATCVVADDAVASDADATVIKAAEAADAAAFAAFTANAVAASYAAYTAAFTAAYTAYAAAKAAASRAATYAANAADDKQAMVDWQLKEIRKMFDNPWR